MYYVISGVLLNTQALLFFLCLIKVSNLPLPGVGQARGWSAVDTYRDLTFQSPRNLQYHPSILCYTVHASTDGEIGVLRSHVTASILEICLGCCYGSVWGRRGV